MKILFPIVGTALFLFGVNAFAQSMEADAIIGVSYSKHGVRLQAPSGGCTSKGSFRVLKETSGALTLITFQRVVEDKCLALLPFGVALTYSFDELGLGAHERVLVTNPLAPIEILRSVD